MKKIFSCCIALFCINRGQAQNVGIGTATPVSKLEVRDGTLTVSNTLSSAVLVINKANALPGASTEILFENNGTSKWVIGGSNIGSAAGDHFSLYNYNLGLNSLTILSGNNNIGIGTTTPGSALEIAGQITITGGSPGAGKVLTSNDIGLATWQTPNIETTHSIGESYGGGIVFYITPNHLHGLIAETQDQGVYDWYNAPNIISEAASHSTAGKQYTDWRLPTEYELSLLYIQSIVVGNFANEPYMSSTLYSESSVTDIFFFDGSQGFGSYTYSFHIRAVRSF